MSNISRVFLEPSAVVCVESVIQGDVRIGHRTIVHPHAQILATNGPIIIGNENIFEEYSVLENRSPFPLIVGNQNFFEVKSVVRARKIGHNNLFNVKCTVGEMVTVGNYTTFGVNVLTNPASPIKPADLSVFFGNDPTQHRISATKPDVGKVRMSNISRIFLEPSAVVCVESVIQGDVRIGHRTIVHPNAQILATNGPIIIGNENIFEEFSVLENRSPFPLIVGNKNVFEVKSVVRARKIGHNNLFNVKCIVGEMVTVGNYTSFGVNALTNPASPIKPADLSVFFGKDPTQHRISATKPDDITDQIDWLAQVLPRYHHIKKTSRQF